MTRKKEVTESESSAKPVKKITKKAFAPLDKPISKKSKSDSISSTNSVTTISAEERRRMIAQTAYFMAEQRGFSGGDPVADWLEAEREVDQHLKQFRLQ